VADIAAGMYALTSIMAALMRRGRTGEGATLDISMFEALGEWMGFPAYFAHYGGDAPPRSGAFHATIAPYGPFRTGSGETVFLGVQNDREFARLCDIVLGNAALAVDSRFASGPARDTNRDALKAEIEQAFAGIDAAQAIERLERAGIANARMNDMHGFWSHPQSKARERWVTVPTPAGPIDALKPPFNLSGFEPRMDAVPAIGEQTRDILGEIGYDAAAIARLQADGAL
jgi:itaconate CoA-transferase